MTDITMPRLSDSMEEGTILRWLVDDGQPVAVGDDLVEIETDKATMAHTADEEGILEIVAAEGTTLAVGEVIARVGDGTGDRGAGDRGRLRAGAGRGVARTGRRGRGDRRRARRGGAAVGRRIPARTRRQRRHGGGGRDAAGATHRRRARHPAGARGRQRPARADHPRRRARRRRRRGAPAARRLQRRAGRRSGGRAAHPRPRRPARRRAIRRAARSRSRPPRRLQQVIARRMAESKATAPDFQVETEVAMDAVVALRARLKAAAGEGEVVPSLNDFVVKACASALRRHPRANGAYRDGTLRAARAGQHRRGRRGRGRAGRADRVRRRHQDAWGRSAATCARWPRRSAAGRVEPRELEGGTFTVSNLGMFGMTAITPVLNAGQAGILGRGRAARGARARRRGDRRRARCMTLRLSCDHRILYGADAARFLADIRDLLEEPLRLAL